MNEKIISSPHPKTRKTLQIYVHKYVLKNYYSDNFPGIPSSCSFVCIHTSGFIQNLKRCSVSVSFIADVGVDERSLADVWMRSECDMPPYSRLWRTSHPCLLVKASNVTQPVCHIVLFTSVTSYMVYVFRTKYSMCHGCRAYFKVGIRIIILTWKKLWHLKLIVFIETKVMMWQKLHSFFIIVF